MRALVVHTNNSEEITVYQKEETVLKAVFQPRWNNQLTAIMEPKGFRVIIEQIINFNGFQIPCTSQLTFRLDKGRKPSPKIIDFLREDLGFWIYSTELLVTRTDCQITKALKKWIALN